MRESTFVVFVFVRLYFVYANLMNNFDKCNTSPRFFRKFFADAHYSRSRFLRRGAPAARSMLTFAWRHLSSSIFFFPPLLLAPPLQTKSCEDLTRTFFVVRIKVYARDDKGLRS